MVRLSSHTQLKKKRKKEKRKKEERDKQDCHIFSECMFTASVPAWFLPFPQITHIWENHILELNIRIFLETEKAES